MLCSNCGENIDLRADICSGAASATTTQSSAHWFQRNRFLCLLAGIAAIIVGGCNSDKSNSLKSKSENETAAAAEVRAIDSTQTLYTTTYPARGYAPNLDTLEPGPGAKCGGACLLDRTLECSNGTWCVKAAYKYSVVGIGSPEVKDYVITATPLNSDAGGRRFCSTA